GHVGALCNLCRGWKRLLLMESLHVLVMSSGPSVMNNSLCVQMLSGRMPCCR
ncbi:hypothetical protein KI387_001285, partial [Taxus chinensis]